jgi:1,4-alpha-glucan branching enzyme
MADTLSPAAVQALVTATSNDPFALLGPHRVEHEGQPAWAVRVLLPWATGVQVVRSDTGTAYDAWPVHPQGLFEAIIPGAEGFAYRLEATNGHGQNISLLDPYNYGPQLSEFDLHLIGEGNHFRTYEKLGAHVIEVGGVRGVHFAVWAPNAQRVSVIGNFNGWDERIYPMRLHPAQGIWELFIPNLREGEAYKYSVLSRYNGFKAEKADPYGVYSELTPHTASVVYDLRGYEWHDGDWLAARRTAEPINRPMSIYEVHLGSWWHVAEQGDRSLTYPELAHQLVDYVKRMGYTHIELLPISEHPYSGSWGYQTVGYYAVTSRYGTPKDFMYLVDQCHQNGIGVFLDWVPAHFPKDIHGLNYFDGTHLYEHADPRLGEQPDWGTLVFNFGRNEVRNFLLSNALFWLDKYHIDGLRVDAVASLLYLDFSRAPGAWVPNRYGGRENLDAIDFLKRFNELVHLEHPDALTMAEDSSDWPMVTRPTFLGGLGFDFKWNMGWMHDMLDYMAFDPIYRRFHHNLITFSLMYAFNENYLLPLSHDEVVHLKKALLNKMPGDGWRQFANLRLLFGYMWTHPGKKLLFMGGDFGMRQEWHEMRSIDWHELGHDSHRGLNTYMRDLLHLYRSQPALWQVDNTWEGFQWLSANDSENSVIAFVRRAKDPADFLVVLCNFTPLPRYDYCVPVPRAGFYRELLNSDAGSYWGSNLGNLGGVEAFAQEWAETGYALCLTLPPLSTLILRPDPLPPPAPVVASAEATPVLTPEPAPEQAASQEEADIAPPPSKPARPRKVANPS